MHIIFFLLFLYENICCGYSLEAPRRGASIEYPQHLFLLRNKNDISIFRMKKASYLLLCDRVYIVRMKKLYILGDAKYHMGFFPTYLIKQFQK